MTQVFLFVFGGLQGEVVVVVVIRGERERGWWVGGDGGSSLLPLRGDEGKNK